MANALKLLIFLKLFLVVLSEDPKSVKYYENLLQDFMQNSSKWENPTDSSRYFKASNEEAIEWGDKFDFIIAGAGIAGSVLTNRLTESGKFKVLVLEAGGELENDFTDVPAFADFLTKSDFNWGYKTTVQENSCLGMKNKQCSYPRGRTVGGGSVINYMLYVRGNKEDFNKWGDENPGWSYKDVLPYFKKSEKSLLAVEDFDFHGHEGRLSVENAKYYPNITNVFLESLQQMGGNVVDYNGKYQLGGSRVQLMTINGRRCSANKAFVKPAMDRKNLSILVNSLVLKVLIDNKKAYGVEFIHDGKKYFATASKEVILSAGSINTPQLLMLSGIGPQQHLENLGIPVVQNLQVGKHLHDHPSFPVMMFATNLTVNAPPLSQHLENYIDGFGMLTAPNAISGVGFTSPRMKSNNNSNIELVFFSAFPEQAAPFFVGILGVTEENWLSIVNPMTGQYSWGLIPILLHPKSVGTIKLKSKNPLDFPLLDFNLYSDPEGDDVEEMLSALKHIFDLSKTPAFQSINSRYLSGPLPACTGVQYLSEDYWRCALKQLSLPMLHAVATCKMGPKSDDSAVVDSKLKVHGIDALRIADASVIPFSTASHPSATVYMIGEKAADIIREEYLDLKR